MPVILIDILCLIFAKYFAIHNLVVFINLLLLHGFKLENTLKISKLPTNMTKQPYLNCLSCNQVTSFAELMVDEDEERLGHNLILSGHPTDIVRVFLKNYLKEDQFTEDIR